MARPYQPSLLRLLHGATAVLVPLAWLSGLLLYSNLDGRWGRLPWRIGGDWIDIHGSIGVALLPLAVLLALYALTLGKARLRQASNSLPLVALTAAIGSGKLMDEDWLREGTLQHPVYSVHLIAWLLVAISVTVHLGAALVRGGPALLRSMLSLRLRPGDLPGQWWQQIQGIWR